MKRFTVILIIFSLFYFYLGWRLASHIGIWVMLAIPFISIISFVSGKKSAAEQHFIFFSMGLLTYLLLFTLIRDVLFLTPYSISPSQVLIFSLTALTLGSFNALRGPKIKSVKVKIPELTPELWHLTIAQISDLHIGPTIGARYVSRVVNKVNELKPTLIALTGDIGDGPVKLYREDITPLKNLKSTLGSFYVPGNHEYYWNANEWMGVLNNLGIIILVNRGKVLEYKDTKILIAGVPDKVSPVPPSPEQALVSNIETKFKILLSHRPDMAARAQAAGYNLMLAGHTHGGQFFPWTIIVKFVHKFHQGLYHWKNMAVYVSSGTGNWGPFLRLGTNSEITLLELVPALDDPKLISEKKL